jgi:hypothetical protein
MQRHEVFIGILLLLISVAVSSSLAAEMTQSELAERDEALVLRMEVCVDIKSGPSNLSPVKVDLELPSCPENAACIGGGCYCHKGFTPDPEGHLCNGVEDVFNHLATVASLGGALIALGLF